MRKLNVDLPSLARNLAMQQGLVVAEPLYIILASLGHPDAHEKVKTLTFQARREQRPLEEVLAADPELQPYLEKMKPLQRQILSNPSLYTGIAAQKAKSVAERWQKKFKL
jgi:adenylosuccinate lyase